LGVKVGDVVEIETFWGSKEPDGEVSQEECYWKLIGKRGEVVDIRDAHPAFAQKGPQVLVRFFEDIGLLGLEVHNEVENGLWFFVDDVRVIKSV